MDKIERELNALNKQIWFQTIRKSKFAIGLVLGIVAILLWNIYRSGDKVIEEETFSGVLIGIHQMQSYLGSSTTMLSIKLKNGENVMVEAPSGLVVRNNARVEIVKGKTYQGAVYYYFQRYIPQ